MKQQQKLWNRLMDSLLPKMDPKRRVIDVYRSRALVRTALLGSLLNPFLFLFESSAFTLWQTTGIVLTLVFIPLLLIWLYRSTGWLKVCGSLYVFYSSALCAWAQLMAGTVHALYWVWIPFLIVFSVLVLGVKAAAIYTGLALLFFAGIMQHAARFGHTVGRFQDADALLASITLQILVIQICFFMLMVAYDVIRNRAEVRAVLLRMTDDEAARLATRGERMGSIAQELHEELGQFRSQLQQLDGLAKRSDTKVEDVQTVMRELQAKTQKLSEISRRAHG
ncbi:MAG TPA: hypothetical protein VFO10_12255 [Oligoflexus sp.]|uniref:hypothetical protein n=1 Tax=Oligoflexus sp. TaxID=1971216 RepID=UPI002D7FF09B|nr:hypothetical protein [Oligoflexus sp.]HET9238021.1 hypothetical protein [Oligoflexus sp.]